MNDAGKKNLARSVGDPYENLANAIILQACDDLRAELKGTKRGSDRTDEITGLEEFFKSRWFGVLTKLDGKQILTMIEKEFE